MAAETLAAAHSGPAPVSALVGELTRRGITVRILDAGPDSEGAVAQLVDPAARDMARWAAWRQLAPATLYGISLGLGLVAAMWFAELAVRAKLLAIVALAGSFLVARAGSVLAAASPDGRIRPVVSWLGAACGLLTELRSRRPGGQLRPGPGDRPGRDLRRRAAEHLRGQLGRHRDGRRMAAGHRRALVLGIRRMAELGYEHTARVPGNLFPRSALRRTLEQAVTFPAGERSR